MTYSVTRTASELMLEPQDLKAVFEVFFLSTSAKITESRTFLHSGDLKALSRSMHALKGLALSLHMISIGELAAIAERADSLSPEALLEILDQLEKELKVIQKEVQAFYK